MEGSRGDERITGEGVSWDVDALIREPVIVLAAPRSGSSLLLAVLSAHPDLWSLYRESNQILEGPLHPRVLGTDSHALSADDLSRHVREELLRSFYARVGNLEKLPFARRLPLRGRGRRSYGDAINAATRPFKRPPIRIVEKSPRNTVRIPLVRELFPDAKFLHLTRDAAANIRSLCGGWLDPDHYNVHPLPDGFHVRGYAGSHWSFVLQPGWHSLNGASLVDVCADQWRVCNERCVVDLQDLPPDRALRIKFEDLVRSPWESLLEVATWADLDPTPFVRFASGLPVIQRSTRHRASEDMISHELESKLEQLAGLRARLGYV